VRAGSWISIFCFCGSGHRTASRRSLEILGPRLNMFVFGRPRTGREGEDRHSSLKKIQGEERAPDARLLGNRCRGLFHGRHPAKRLDGFGLPVRRKPSNLEAWQFCRLSVWFWPKGGLDWDPPESAPGAWPRGTPLAGHDEAKLGPAASFIAAIRLFFLPGLV
jgi:hypothetical protein